MSNVLVTQNSLVRTNVAFVTPKVSVVILMTFLSHYSCSFFASKSSLMSIKDKNEAVHQGLKCVYLTLHLSELLTLLFESCQLRDSQSCFAFLQSLDLSTGGIWKLQQKGRAGRVKCAFWALALSASLL